jgi:dethiobiotin synthetase
MIKDKNYAQDTSLFITATNTNVGKTYACEKFLRHYAKKGFQVGYFKPIETGVKNSPADGSAMLKLAQELNPNFNVTIDDVVPYQFELPAAPFVAKGDVDIDMDFLIKKREFLFQYCDFLIIEGAGGLLVPIENDFFIIDMIRQFQTKAALIVPSRLGSINDTLLSQEALHHRDIDFDWYINLYEDKESFEQVTLPFYKTYFNTIQYVQDL